MLCRRGLGSLGTVQFAGRAGWFAGTLPPRRKLPAFRSHMVIVPDGAVADAASVPEAPFRLAEAIGNPFGHCPLSTRRAGLAVAGRANAKLSRTTASIGAIPKSATFVVL